MGTKYATISASGYNSSPPSDDGSQTASNLVAWSTHKTKLTDPIKTEVDAVNTALVTAFDYSVRSVTGSDSTIAGDHMRCVEIASTVTTAVTIALGDAATMTNVYRVFVKNSSARNQTVARVTGADTIDGVAANVTLAPGAGMIFQTTNAATGYLTNAEYGPTIDTNPIVVGGADGTKKVRLEVDGLTTATTRVLTIQDQDMTIGPVLGTPTVTTSGTAINVTSIPSWVKEIDIQFVGVSTNGTALPLVQIGDTGGIQTSGYLGGSSLLPDGSAIVAANFTTGFGIASASAGAVLHGTITLRLENASAFTWVASGVLANSASASTFTTAGSKSLSAALDRIRLTTNNGTDTFDLGAINVLLK